MTVYKDLFLLEGLGSAEKEAVISALPPVKVYRKGEFIYSAESFIKALGIVVSGEALALTDNGGNMVMKKFTAGMCFGAAAVFGGGHTYVSRVISTAETEILFISEDTLTNIFTKYPKTALNYIKFLSDKVRFLNSKLSIISCSGAEDTVLKYLSLMSDRKGYAEIPKNMTMFSKMLGIGRATLYRSIDSLEKNGCIIRDNNKIKVIKNEKTD